MFEKEAKEYRESITQRLFNEDDVEGAWQRGAEFGYNKANEWQYPSKGKYPKENKRYLCKIKAFVGCGISYECFDYDTEYSSWKDSCGEVIAWKEIVLPELKE